MTTDELFQAGYAIPLYGLYEHTWRRGLDEITLPHGVVEVMRRDGIPVAKWADVLEAKQGLYYRDN